MKKKSESSLSLRDKWNPVRRLRFHLSCLLFLITAAGAFSQNVVTVTGTITEENGTPMPGVNVLVTGTTIGVMTDAGGKFLLNVPAGRTTLTCSYIGFESKTVEIGNRTVVNVTMNYAVNQLNEIIAIGYTNRSRTEISSSFAKVESEQLQKSTSNNIVQGLQGKVAGVMILNNQQNVSGQPDIRIRGTGTLSTDAKPLWVVDGVIGGSYDPNDVESVTVLKDAGATGLYGSRAANGVIVVTTRSGKGTKELFTFDAKVGLSTPNFGNIKYQGTPELYPLIREGYINAGRSVADFYAAYPDSTINFDWEDWFYSPALNQNYSLSYANSNERTSMYMSANYYNEEGMLRATAFNRFSTTIKLDHKLSDKASLSVGLYGEYNEAIGNQMNTDPITPFDRPYHDDGTVIPEAEVKATYKQLEKLNPALVVETGSYNNFYTFKVNPYLNFRVELLPWLSFASNTRMNLTQRMQKEYQGKGSQLAYSVDGAVHNANDLTYDILNNELLSFEKSFGAHSFSGLIGAEFNYIQFENIDATATGLMPGSEVLSAAAAPKTILGTKRITTFNSYFSQVNYNYKQTYFFTGSYRIDGSSRFGSNNRYGNFWSVAGSYLISNEDFIKSIGFIDELRIRASYGLTGNANLPDYMHLRTFSRTSSYDGSNASVPLALGNPNLTWEIAKTFNTGFNLALFNRVNVTFDYYNKVNNDLLYNVPLDGSTGYDLQWQNLGRLDVWGYDLSVNADIVKRGGFTWNADLQLGYNQDKVVDIPNTIKGTMILEEGGAHYQWYHQEWAGVDPATGNPMWYMHDAETEERLKNKAGSDSTTFVYNNATRIRGGKATPDFMGGFTNTFSYKGFTVNLDWNFAFGNYTLMRDGNYDHDGASNLKALLDIEGETRWHKPGDIATQPRYVINNTSYSASVSSRYRENGNYLKLATIALGYNFPKKITDKLHMKGLSVFVRGENLKLWTKAIFYTPEYAGFDGTPAGRYDRPFPSKTIGGLSVKF
ncbi:MAG: SusC/RagA family TonB-linked outer membrane protein [Bacteroidales bacterium]|nr:SusC/RagA family TonB-linked outer membrane protein [Bacteroidales bacterium]